MTKMYLALGACCLAAALGAPGALADTAGGSGGTAAAASAPATTAVGTRDTSSGNVAGTGTVKQVAPVTDRTSDSDAETEAVRQRFSQRYDGMPVTAVRRTPYGIFEVQLGMELVYTDADVNWVMSGSLIDTATRKDVTAERVEALSAIDFADLPKALAIKQVKGNGERKMAIFEDPNCGYCKLLHKTLKDVDNVTIYTYLFPILSPDSVEKSRNIWCAKNPAEAWRAWMTDGKSPAEAKCDAPTKDVLALGQKLMVRGTPAIFFESGKRSAGAIPAEQIEANL